MSYETVIWEESGGVGRLTLNRPETLNAWTSDFGRELKHVVEVQAADEAVRAVLITGAGRGFSSGADLKAGFEPAEDGMPDIEKELHEVYHPVIAGVRRLPKPVVAAVNGPAVGIGCSLALACDLVLAGESAFFGLAFVNIGLMPDGGSTAFVPPAVGKARAFQMALLGERVPAQQALDVGSGQLGPRRRSSARRGRDAHCPARGRTDSFLRRHQSRPSIGSFTATSMASSTSRPSFSTSSAVARTSWKGRSRSSRSARRRSPAPDGGLGDAGRKTQRTLTFNAPLGDPGRQASDTVWPRRPTGTAPRSLGPGRVASSRPSSGCALTADRRRHVLRLEPVGVDRFELDPLDAVVAAQLDHGSRGSARGRRGTAIRRRRPPRARRVRRARAPRRSARAHRRGSASSPRTRRRRRRRRATARRSTRSGSPASSRAPLTQ